MPLWFETLNAKLPGYTPSAEAIPYALNQWGGFDRFLEDGRIKFDSNRFGRTMRPVALSRKDSLFASSDEDGENSACMASLIKSC